MPPIVWFLLVIPFGIVLFFIIALVGFQVPSPIQPPRVEGGSPQEEALRKDLPAALSQYFTENNGSPVLRSRRAVAWGRGRMLINSFPIIKRMWLPTIWVLYLNPGKEFFLSYSVTWFGMPSMEGGDQYVQGRGRIVTGQNDLKNANVDRSEETLMWLYTLFASPDALLDLPRSAMEGGNKEKLTLKVPSAHGDDLQFDLVFARERGELTEVHTQRPTARDGRVLTFVAKYSGYAQVSEGIYLPSKLVLEWEDDPYIELSMKDVRYNAGIDEILAGRVVVEEAVEAETTEDVEEEVNGETTQEMVDGDEDIVDVTGEEVDSSASDEDGSSDTQKAS